MLPAGAMTRRWAFQTRYTLQDNTASIIKDLILIRSCLSNGQAFAFCLRKFWLFVVYCFLMKLKSPVLKVFKSHFRKNQLRVNIGCLSCILYVEQKKI